LKANEAFVKLLATVAKQNNATPAQIALAWILGRRPWIVPIPGTTRIERLTENNKATEIVLNKSDLARLDAESQKIKPQGERYPEHLQARIDR
jgi:aryl-alcohol dehydrogenase-like predicted oxidoreductase